MLEARELVCLISMVRLKLVPGVSWFDGFHAVPGIGLDDFPGAARQHRYPVTASTVGQPDEVFKADGIVGLNCCLITKSFLVPR